MIYRRRFSLLEVFLFVTWIALLCGLAASVCRLDRDGPPNRKPLPPAKIVISKYIQTE
jgi:hypothetical protein